MQAKVCPKMLSSLAAGPVPKKKLDNELGAEIISKYIAQGIIETKLIPSADTLVYKNDPSTAKSIIKASNLETQLGEILSEIETLKSSLEKDNMDVDALIKERIELLHTYNDVKDIGQMLLGQCAVMEGQTTKEMYDKFGIDLND
jgi:hypothetical protein